MASPAKTQATVRSIQSYGEGVFAVELSVPARHTRFHPGQFLHLTLDAFDPSEGYWPESRVFSIASQPRQDYLTIVYSVKGRYTGRMERELAPGKQVWIKLPYGDFVVGGENHLGKLILIAGGTGVSPFLPFLFQPAASARPVQLFYGVRRAENILFAQQLRELTSSSWFRLHLMIEEGGGDLPHEKGRLSINHVHRHLEGDLSEAQFYISGPPAMIKAFRTDLIEKKVPIVKIHIDEWE